MRVTASAVASRNGDRSGGSNMGSTSITAYSVAKMAARTISQTAAGYSQNRGEAARAATRGGTGGWGQRVASNRGHLWRKGRTGQAF